MPPHVRKLFKLPVHLGLLPAAVYVAQRFRLRYTHPEKPISFYSRHAAFPVQCRPGTSDVDVFNQIFVHREYRCLDDVKDVGLVLDCGANVGFSAAYFLSRFPKAYVIAIEPDDKNFAMLERNLSPYAGRYRAVCSGVWSHPAGLVMSEQAYADGREWARTVREVRPGETPAMTAIDIGTLLKESGYDRISVLKVDIEGAESIVFASNYQDWIHKVDNLVIELHSDECRSIFRKAISDVNFQLSQCDELTVCKLAA